MNFEKQGWVFAQTPIWAACDERLDDGAHRLFVYLVWRQGNNDSTWPSIQTMADDLGVSYATIHRRLETLIKAGYIVKETRDGRSSLYSAIADPENASAKYTPGKNDRRNKETPVKSDSGVSQECKTTSCKNDIQNDTQERESCNDIPPAAGKTGNALLDSFGLHGPDWPERGKIPKTRPASEQPWLECAPWLRTRDGISAESLQHVYWLLRDTTGLEPTDGERPGWAKALAMVYQAASGDFAAMERGMRAVWARERQYRPGHARGFVDEVRKAMQPIEMDPEKAEFERCRAAMEADPQYQMFKGRVKYG